MMRWGTGVCLAMLMAGLAGAAEVEFVVGGLTKSEGGDWNPAESALRAPFGVAFDSNQFMWIVELDGGRVFRRSASGELKHVGGDGSRSYRGDVDR